MSSGRYRLTCCYGKITYSCCVIAFRTDLSLLLKGNEFYVSKCGFKRYSPTNSNLVIAEVNSNKQEREANQCKVETRKISLPRFHFLDPFCFVFVRIISH